MSHNKRFTGSAATAAILILSGAAGAAPALADEQAAVEWQDVSAEQIGEASREQARRANEAAVEEAAEAVEADMRLDLDIRMIGHTLLLIAGDV